MVNKFTITGAALLGYSWVSKKDGLEVSIPEGALAGKTGGSMILGGAIGGLLDDASKGTVQSPSTARITRSTSQGTYGGLNSR